MQACSYYCKCLGLLLFVSLANLWPLNVVAQSDPTKDYPAFHRNPQRTGWIPNETKLTPANVKGGQFGPIWNSAPFDSVSVGGKIYPPRMYASPLYIDGVTLSSGTYAGQHVSMVVAATSNGYLYAVNPFARNDAAVIPAGYTFWATKLTNPEIIPNLDGDLPLGVMGTPIIFAAAGAAFKANVQQFQVTPDAKGTIVLNYSYGTVGNPLASGIEVIP